MNSSFLMDAESSLFSEKKKQQFSQMIFILDHSESSLGT